MDVPGTALITGAGSGIGRACALGFARSGAANLALIDINLSSLESTQLAISRLAEKQKNPKSSPEIALYAADVTKEDQVEEAIVAAAARFGRIDYAVHAAGIAGKHAGGVAFAKTSDWTRIVDVDLTGTFFVLRATARVMLAQSPVGSILEDESEDEDSFSSSVEPVEKSNGNTNGASKEEAKQPTHRGSLVCVSSIQGAVGIPESAAYGAAKHGVIGLVRSASEDYAARGLRVNAVCPGYTRTPLTLGLPAVRAAMEQRVEGAEVPMRRAAKPREIADAVLFLAGGRSSYVTGTALFVDGGYTQR